MKKNMIKKLAAVTMAALVAVGGMQLISPGQEVETAWAAAAEIPAKTVQLADTAADTAAGKATDNAEEKAVATEAVQTDTWTCPNGYDCPQGGACQNGDCPYDGDCPNDGIRPQDGTGYKHGAATGGGNGAGNNGAAAGVGNGSWGGNQGGCQGLNPDCPNDGVRPQDGTGFRGGRNA